MSIKVARATLSERLNTAKHLGEHTILLRRSEVAGVIVPPEWYQTACRAIGDPWEDWSPDETTPEG